MRRTTATLAMIALAIAATLGFGTAAGAQDGTGTVTVIHGVPGVDVDVYVNGDLTLEGFTPETVTDPLELPAGDYTVDIRPAGADAASDPIITGSTTLPAGANATLIAHLTADGTPTLGVFVNDTTPTAAGEGRLVVRHTAAAPAVDILAGGDPVFTGLTNPNEESADLPAGTVSAAVALAGTTDPVLGPADVDVQEGTSTIVYAWGSAQDGNLALAVQTIGGLHSAPSGVPSGTAEVPADPTPVALAGIALAAALAAGAMGLRARRVRA